MDGGVGTVVQFAPYRPTPAAKRVCIGPHMASARRTVSVTGALRAHFKQPGGPSRAGADWAVVVDDGDQQKRILVRTYADDVGPISDKNDEAQLVIAYVAGLLESGWSPEQYKGEPGELVVPRGQTPAPRENASASKRPWWRFW